MVMRGIGMKDEAKTERLASSLFITISSTLTSERTRYSWTLARKSTCREVRLRNKRAVQLQQERAHVAKFDFAIDCPVDSSVSFIVVSETLDLLFFEAQPPYVFFGDDRTNLLPGDSLPKDKLCSFCNCDEQCKIE